MIYANIDSTSKCKPEGFYLSLFTDIDEWHEYTDRFNDFYLKTNCGLDTTLEDLDEYPSNLADHDLPFLYDFLSSEGFIPVSETFFYKTS